MLEVFTCREVMDLFIFIYMFLLNVYEYEKRKYKWIDVLAMFLLCVCAGTVAYCAISGVEIKQLAYGNAGHVLFLVVFFVEFAVYWIISWRNVKLSRLEAKLRREQDMRKLEEIEKNV